MFATYDTSWTVLGVRVPRALVLSVGSVVAAGLLLLAGVAAGITIATGHPSILPPPGPVSVSPMAAYADGAGVTLDGAEIDVAPAFGTLAQARPLYVVAYPFNDAGCTTQCNPAPTLATGYAPECAMPCFLAGVAPTFAYHDRILDDGAAVQGAATPGQPSTWQMVMVEYNPGWVYSPTFHPFTSAAALQAALADPTEASTDFVPLRIEDGGVGRFQVITGIVVTGQVQASATNSASNLAPAATAVPTRAPSK